MGMSLLHGRMTTIIIAYYISILLLVVSEFLESVDDHMIIILKT